MSTVSATDVAVAIRVNWLTRLLGVGALALVGATWRLWTPQDIFPRAPLLFWAPPDWWDWTSLGLIAVGALGLFAVPTVMNAGIIRGSATAVASGFAIAFLCDQHRLQPWAWQLFILAVLVALADDRFLLRAWRWLVISIYFYSALSKFDAAFIGQMATGMLQSAHIHSLRLPSQSLLDRTWEYLAWMMPAGELAVALLLAWPQTRRWGLWASVFMHLALLQLLGPAGLNHSFGVLGWNVFFLLQNVVLFSADAKPSAAPPRDVRLISKMGRFRNRCAALALTAVLIWPLFEPWGGCDAWLGWAVYVPRFDHGKVVLVDSRQSGIPVVMQGQTGFSVQAWSLNALGVPVYPGLRFNCAVACELSERFPKKEFRVIEQKRSRWSLESSDSQRQYRRGDFPEMARRFWFNPYPTSLYRRRAREPVEAPWHPGIAKPQAGAR